MTVLLVGWDQGTVVVRRHSSLKVILSLTFLSTPTPQRHPESSLRPTGFVGPKDLHFVRA